MQSLNSLSPSFNEKNPKIGLLKMSVKNEGNECEVISQIPEAIY